MAPKKDLGAILLRGNHEQMTLNFMDQNDPLWLFNGGYATLKQLLGNVSLKSARDQFKTTSREHFYHDFFNIMPLTYQTTYQTNEMIFVHAAYPLYPQMTVDPLWSTGLYWYVPGTKVFAHNTTNKTIVCGHTPTFLIRGSLTADNFYQNPRTTDSELLIVRYLGEKTRIFADGWVSFWCSEPYRQYYCF